MNKKKKNISFHLLRFKKINPEILLKNIKFMEVFYKSINLLHQTSYSLRFWQILSEHYIINVIGFSYFVNFFKLENKKNEPKKFSFFPNRSNHEFHNSIANESIIWNIINLKKIYNNQLSLVVKKSLTKPLKKNFSIKLFLIYFFFNKISLALKFFFKLKLIGSDIFNLRFFIILLKNKKSLFFLPNEKIEKDKNKFDPLLRKKLFNLGSSFLNTKEDLELWYSICFLIPTSLIEDFYIKKEENIIDIFLLSQMNMELEKKMKIAIQVENGSQLKIFNHGGNYFSFNCQFHDYHEVQISDIYYSWADTHFLKMKDSFALRNHKPMEQIPTFNIICKNKKKIFDFVLINNSFSFNPAPCNSNPVLNQVYKQANDVLKFLNSVVNVTDKFAIKDVDNVGHISPRIFYNKQLAEKVLTANLNLLISKSKLAVNSYYGTPFHHLMANDIPNIIFIKLSYYDFNKVFLSYLKEFQKFQVVHFNALSAAKFLENNIEHIDDIWNEAELVKFRKDFNLKFNQSPYNWQKKIYNLL